MVIISRPCCEQFYYSQPALKCLSNGVHSKIYHIQLALMYETRQITCEISNQVTMQE